MLNNYQNRAERPQLHRVATTISASASHPGVEVITTISVDDAGTLHPAWLNNISMLREAADVPAHAGNPQYRAQLAIKRVRAALDQMGIKHR